MNPLWLNNVITFTGQPNSSDAHACIDELGRILHSSIAETARKNKVRELLSEVADDYPDKVYPLLNASTTTIPNNHAVDNQLTRFNSADDPELFALAQQYQSDTEALYRIVSTFITLVRNRISQEETAEYFSYLTDLQAIFSAYKHLPIKDSHQQQISSWENKLKKWHTSQAINKQFIELEQLVKKSPKSLEDWQAIENQFWQLKEKPQNDQQDSLLQNWQLLVYNYDKWRDYFTKKMDLFNQLITDDIAVFPWLTNAVCAEAIHFVEDNISNFSTVEQKAKWIDKVDDLFCHYLNRAINGDNIVYQLQSLTQFESDWLGAFSALTNPTLFAEKKEVIYSLINEQAKIAKQQVINNHKSGIITNNEICDGFGGLLAHTNAYVSELLTDNECLQGILERAEQYWAIGFYSYLTMPQHSVDKEDLERLCAIWDSSIYYQHLIQRFTMVCAELKTLQEVDTITDEQKQITLLASLTSHFAHSKADEIKSTIAIKGLIKNIEKGETLTEDELSVLSGERVKRYQDIQEGKIFITNFVSNVEKMLTNFDFEQAITLYEQLVPTDKLLEEWLVVWKEKRAILYDNMTRQIGAQLKGLKKEMPSFPLLTSKAIELLTTRFEYYKSLIERSDLARDRVTWDAVIYEIEAMLSIHNVLLNNDFQAATDILASLKLSYEHRKPWLALIAFSQCEDEISWLNFYSDYYELADKRKDHYIQVFCACVNLSDNASLLKHRNIISHNNLNPELLAVIDYALEEKNTLALAQDGYALIFIRRLLEQWSKEISRYKKLKDLWLLLPESLQLQLQVGNKNPVMQVEEEIGLKLNSVVEDFNNANTDITQLKKRLQEIKESGFIDSNKDIESMPYNLETAFNLESYFRNLAEKDPWSSDAKALLVLVEKSLDSINATLEVKARWGWSGKLSTYKNGQKAWFELAKWQNHFQVGWQACMTPLHQKPDDWQKIINIISDWNNHLKIESARIDWLIPNALISDKWQAFLKNWQTSDEGLRNDNIDSMEKIIETFLSIEQSLRFAFKLHNEMLGLVPWYLNKEDIDNIKSPLLNLAEQLENLPNCCRFIEEFKKHLFNPIDNQIGQTIATVRKN